MTVLMATFAIGITSQVLVVDGEDARVPVPTRLSTKAPFGDRSATSCAPSHRSGQVVVRADIASAKSLEARL